MEHYDIAIIGGGFSGTMAAIAAARMGAKIILVDRHGFLGGTITACGVGPLATFHAGNKQIIKGITQELIERLMKKGKCPGHLPDTSHFVASLTPCNVEGLKVELEDMVLEAGGELLYHTMVGAVDVTDGIIKSVTLCNKAGLTKLTANVFIDATGDADIAYWAGVPCTFGRKKDGLSQPMTLICNYVNVDSDKLRKFIIDNGPDGFERMFRDINILKNTPLITTSIGYVKQLEAAKKRNEIHIPRDNLIICETDRAGEFLLNCTRIIRHNGTNPNDLTNAEIMGRKQVEELDSFVHKYIPGFENAILVHTGPQIGVRSTRQIIGKYTLTLDDVLSRRTFNDVICYSGFPVDIHNPDGEGTENIYSESGTYISIPYSILITNEISNLIISGRCISAEFEAQSAIRTAPIVGAMGHAAGIAAALAASVDYDTRNINIQKLQELLKEQKAFLEN